MCCNGNNNSQVQSGSSDLFLRLRGVNVKWIFLRELEDMVSRKFVFCVQVAWNIPWNTQAVIARVRSVWRTPSVSRWSTTGGYCAEFFRLTSLFLHGMPRFLKRCSLQQSKNTGECVHSIFVSLTVPEGGGIGRNKWWYVRTVAGGSVFRQSALIRERWAGVVIPVNQL